MRRGQGPETKIWYRVKPSEAKDYTKFIDKYVGVVAGMLKNNGVVIDSKDPEDVVQTIARKGMLGYVLKGAQVQSKRFGIPSIHSASKADPQLA